MARKKRGIFGKVGSKGKWIVLLLVLILLGLLGYFFLRRSANQNAQEAGALPPETPLSETTPPSETTSVPAQEPESLSTNANYQSEHFRVGDIAIGGEAEFLFTEDTPDPLAISSIRGEAFTAKNKPEVELVLSFKTNKLAKSVVAYSKGAGQPEKKVDEEGYSLDHSLIIPGLEQASTYIYTITANDRFGNVVASDPHAVYTGSKTVSLFDLIASAISDVFGWAINK